MDQTNYIFGYGSLLSAQDIERTLGHPPKSLIPATLTGWIRDWGVVLDNTTTIRRYETLPDHQVPHYVAILNIRMPDDGETATNPNGVLFSVTDEDIAKMDDRENHYVRKDVTDQIDGRFNGKVYAYVGMEQFLATTALESQAVLPQSYKELVERGFAKLGGENLARFQATTLPSRVQVVSTVHTSTVPE